MQFTETQVAEEEDKTSKHKKLESIFFVHDALNKSTDIHFFAIDKNLKILYVNNYYKHVIGIELQVGDRFPIEDLYNKEAVEGFYDITFPKVMAGETVNGEVFLLGKNKEEIPLRFSSFPVMNEAGEVIAYASFGANIAHEVEMKLMVDWQRGILQNTKDMLVSFDKHWKIVYCNPALNEVTGWMDTAEATLIDERCFTKESFEYVIETIIPLLGAGEIHTCKLNLITRFGLVIPTSTNFFPIVDSDKKIIGFGATLHDITEQRKFEVANERAEIALGLARAGSWEIAVQEKMLYYDERFEKMLHLPKSPISIAQCTEYLSTLLDEEVYSELFDYLRNHFDGNMPSDYKNMYMKFSDGSFMYSNCMTKVLYEEQGRPERLLGVTWDTTKDVLEQQIYEEMKERQLRSQEFISSFSVPFTQPNDDFSSLIQNALSEIRLFFDADRASIYEFQGNKSMQCKYSSVKGDDIPNVVGACYPYEHFEALFKEISDKQYLYTKKAQKFYEDYPIILANAKSLCLISIKVEGVSAGLLILCTHKQEADWTESEFQPAIMASSIIAGAYSIEKKQKELMNINERLQLALEVAKSGTWEMSVTDQMMTFDDGFAKILQIPFESPVPMRVWGEFISRIAIQEEYAEFNAYLKDNFDGSIGMDFIEKRFDLLDGTIKYVSTSSKIYYNENNKPERLVGMLRDVTEETISHKKYKKIREKQLRSQEFISNFSVPFTQPYEEFGDLINNALFELRVFFETDRATIFEFMEDGTLECTYESSATANLPPIYGKRFENDKIKEVCAEIDKYPFYYHQSTKEFYAKYPTVSLGAKSTCYIPIVMDGSSVGYLVITDYQKEADWSETEFRPAMMASSIIAGAYSIRKSENSLKAATVEAQSANIAKSQFISNMSHEIRTPLNAIIGTVKLLEKTDSLEKCKKYMSNIQMASEHLLSIINDILDISKIESGKFELNPDVFSLERTIIKACTLMSEKAEEKNIKLSINSGDDLGIRYMGDDVRISQILTNLLSNAVKFTPGGGEISVFVDEIGEENNKNKILISVADTGIGMSEEQQMRVFNFFEQADGSISRKFGGTGLGLAISKSFARMMGGSISVESELGKGSTFTVTILLDKAEEEEREVYRILREQFSGLRIILLSDDDKVISRFVRLSERFNIACEITRNSDDAKAKILEASEKKQLYDVVFFDFSYRDEGMLSNYNEVKNLFPEEALVPIIEFNAWNSIQDEIIEYGSRMFLQKPILESPLYDCLMEVVYHAKTEGVQTSLEIPDFSKVNLLLAEDIEINSEILKSILEDTGINIEVAINGEIAVEMFRNNPEKYNLIFMDVQMPIMNGLDATRAIRTMDIPRAKTIPIIAMTANVFKEDIDTCFEAGMNDHLGKPIKLSLIIAKIRKYI